MIILRLCVCVCELFQKELFCSFNVAKRFFFSFYSCHFSDMGHIMLWPLNLPLETTPSVAILLLSYVIFYSWANFLYTHTHTFLPYITYTKINLCPTSSKMLTGLNNFMFTNDLSIV